MSTNQAANLTGNLFPSYFCTTDWLANQLQENQLQQEKVRIIQVGGEKYYPQFHIPGASLISYKELVTIRETVPGVRADSSVLSELFGNHGINLDTPVLAYDLSSGMDAARAIWTLASLGHQQGAILDGGLGVWFKEKHPVNHLYPQIEPCTFVAQANPEWEVNEQEVLAASQADQPTSLILDTRTTQEYQGLTIRNPRGHIAGAQHFNWVDSLRHNNDPRLKDKDRLLSLFAKLGVTDTQQEIIVYCETGHRAAQTWLLLRQLGFSRVRLYDGSIAEWRVRQNPVVSGGRSRED